MNWQDLLSELGMLGILSTLMVWLIKSLGNNLISKNFSAYEQTLSLKPQKAQVEFDKILQSYKAQLDLIGLKSTLLTGQTFRCGF